MGLFATVIVDNSIDLPHFPKEIDRSDLQWQCKEGLDKFCGPYRITADGRLERKESVHREKTDEEKQTEAEEYGFDSWSEYIDAYERASGESFFPESIDYDVEKDGVENAPPLYPSSEVTEETYWDDINKHGTFEFHQVIDQDGLDVYLEYEARFTEGDLDEIVFMGTRMGYTDDPIEHALEKIEEWQESKE